VPRFAAAIGDITDPRYAPNEAERAAMIADSLQHDLEFLEFIKKGR